jgi:hypothetical protein
VQCEPLSLDRRTDRGLPSGAGTVGTDRTGVVVAMHRFLDAVDQRYGGVCPFLRNSGVPPAVIEQLTEGPRGTPMG